MTKKYSSPKNLKSSHWRKQNNVNNENTELNIKTMIKIVFIPGEKCDKLENSQLVVKDDIKCNTTNKKHQ
jgi:hypothetical protein